jgi:hypothetical protein
LIYIQAKSTSVPKQKYFRRFTNAPKQRRVSNWCNYLKLAKEAQKAVEMTIVSGEDALLLMDSINELSMPAIGVPMANDGA